MKYPVKIQAVMLFIALFFQSGCDENTSRNVFIKNPDGLNISEYPGYLPAKVKILSLTQYVSGAESNAYITAYVTVTDKFGSQIKNTGIFRFEIYHRIPHSSEPKGKRIVIWDDFVLKDAAKNNSYWRDFLRSYQFELPFKSLNEHDYVLEVTFMSPDGERLSDEYTLHVGK